MSVSRFHLTTLALSKIKSYVDCIQLFSLPDTAICHATLDKLTSTFECYLLGNTNAVRMRFLYHYYLIHLFIFLTPPCFKNYSQQYGGYLKKQK